MPSTTIQKRKQHPVEILIDQARELLRPSPVELHVLPSWLAKRIRARFGHTPGCCNSLCRLQRVALIAGRGNDAWFDHWGVAVVDGRPGFISEPYANCADVKAALRFAELLDLEVDFQANSWWYPGQTLRIVFFRPVDAQHQADRYGEPSGGRRNKRNNGATASRGASRRPVVNIGATRGRYAVGDAVGAGKIPAANS